MMIPTIARTTEEMLLLVPQAVREAAYGLGIPRWRTTLSITLRTATSGVITGIMLAFARVAGETAPLLFTALGNQFWNLKVSEPTAALPLQIYTYGLSPYDDWHRQAWAGAFVLIVLIVTAVSAVRFAVRRGILRSGIPMGVGIQVENLNAWYGKTQALYDIYLTVAANHATALIGPSGCGKSTFIRCLNRMHETIPEARVYGQCPHRRNQRLQRYFGHSASPPRGMVFQKPNPFPTMSIYDNVASGLKLNGFRNRGQAGRDRTSARSIPPRCGTR